MEQYTTENFIRVYDGVYDKDYCDSLIDYYEWFEKHSYTQNRNNTNTKDRATFLDKKYASEVNFSTDNADHYLSQFTSKFWDVYKELYCEEFTKLFEIGSHTIFTYKIQKTLPQGGYHIWHCEQDSLERGKRLQVYTLYLNDIEAGGETEFLYLSARVKPKMGSLCIFPGAWTHTHRGNPPLSGAKYILTGWVEFK